ncbi:hypothetical protein OIO90_001496 [Microbotryomycetes sp. JL221]|nr:hypothetical protein OIO90_001496 [Microbotryomycetes sp. JL221]
MTPDGQSVRSVLTTCAVLIGTDEPNRKIGSTNRLHSLGDVLERRLHNVNDVDPTWIPSTSPIRGSERVLKMTTGDVALVALQKLDKLVGSSAQAQPSTSTAPAPTFGVKDIKVISTLAGIVARWAIGLRLQDNVLPPAFSDTQTMMTNKSHSVRIQEIEHDDVSMDESDSKLSETVLDVLSIINNSKHVSSTPGQAQLSSIVAPHVMPLLFAAMTQLANTGSTRQDPASEWSARSQALAQRLNPSATISTLLPLLSSPASPSWFRASIAHLLSTQISRPNGVRSLLFIVIGTGSQSGGQDEVGIKKLDMLYRLLSAPAPGTELASIVEAAVDSSLAPPKSSISRLPPPPPPTILRATTFVLAHLLLSPTTTDVAHRLFLNKIHNSFQPGPITQTKRSTSSSSISEEIDPPVVESNSILKSLTTLSLLLLYSPPLPGFQTMLIGPILASLVCLGCQIGFKPKDQLTQQTKPRLIVVQDKRFEDEVKAILETWGKSVELNVATHRIRQVIDVLDKGLEFGSVEDDVRLEWSIDDQGGWCIRKITRDGDAQRDVSDEDDTRMNVQTDEIVEWLFVLNRKDLSGALFIRWLDELQLLQKQSGFESAKRALVRLKLVLDMVETLGSDILTEPEQIIAFVAHALDVDGQESAEEEPATASEQSAPPSSSSTFGLESLKFVHHDDVPSDSPHQHTKEDEETLIPGLGSDEMAITALTLLLAVLEGHQHLDMASTPLLAIIFDKLDSLAESESDLLPALAREAKLVLSSRRASHLAQNVLHNDRQTSKSTDADEDDSLAKSRSTYQQGLKLLQDPLLPVRAQGLALLKSLVSTKQSFLTTDKALLPALVDIFVQSLEDDDSFLYLNAIQGLSAMADVYGKQVVQRLVEVYTGGTRQNARESVGSGDKGTRELDKRLRMGEALVQVVRRAGQALAVIVDDLVPQLLFVMRTASLPTPLRSSSLTILATTIEIAPLALMPFVSTLAESCLTLLSVESRPIQARNHEADKTVMEQDSDHEEFKFDLDELVAEAKASLQGTETVNDKPKRLEETPNAVTSLDAKQHPSLRRAAIVFLSSLFRMASDQLDQDANHDSEPWTMKLSTLNSKPLLTPATDQRERRSRTNSILSFETIARAKIVLRYVNETDRDELVRYQAGQVLEELQ